MDLSRLYTAGAHVQHEDILSLYIGKEARGAVQDTSKYGYIQKDAPGGVEWDKPAKVIIDRGCPSLTRMTLLTHWEQEVCPELCAVAVVDLWCRLHMLWL